VKTREDSEPRSGDTADHDEWAAMFGFQTLDP